MTTSPPRLPTPSRAALFALLAAAIATLMPRLALAYFAFPSADDYCIFNETRADGFWYMQVHSYLTWTGRYAAVLLESIAVQFDLIAVYRWFSVATVMATIAAIHMLVGAVCGRVVSRLECAAFGLAAAAVFVNGLPSVVEAFYWLPGAASYQWGVVAYFVWLALLIRNAGSRTARDGHGIRRIAIVVLTLVIPGFNEVMAPIIFATLAALLARNRARRIESDGFLLGLVAIVAVLTSISFLAPGNRARSNTYPDIVSRHNLEFAVIETGRQTARFIVRYGAYPALWLAALAAWWWGESRLPGLVRPTGRIARDGAVLAALAAIAYLTLFPVYWEYGEVNYTGEGRTYNVTYVAVCAMVLWVAGCIVALVPARSKDPAVMPRTLRGSTGLLVAAALALLLIPTTSTGTSVQALRMAPDYSTAEHARAAYLRRAPRTGTIFVDPLAVRPPGLFWADIEPDPGHWINDCVAKYYGLSSVRSRM